MTKDDGVPTKDPSKVKGGIARAEALTPEQRHEIARTAALARWDTTASLPRATHGDPGHPLRIGDIEIGCYVLETGQRVISQRSLQTSVGMNVSGGAQRLLRILKTFQDKGVDCKDLSSRITNPITFRTPMGSIGHGYEATSLTDLCDVILSARRAGALVKQQEHFATQCEVLYRGLAKVGIIGLVDEATGYQEVRDRQALQEILERFLRKEFAAWAKKFPDDFYKEIFRLKGWIWQGMCVNRPRIVAKYTEDYVYKRLAPGILEELKRKNPADEMGRRKVKHHQWLTDDIGDPRLAEHLYGLIGLMKACDSWNEFKAKVDRAYPTKNSAQLMLTFADDSDC
jgi:hypothetical protein